MGPGKGSSGAPEPVGGAFWGWMRWAVGFLVPDSSGTAGLAVKVREVSASGTSSGVLAR